MAALMARLRDDRRGSLIIEFAFVLPILVTLALGGFEVVRLALLHQKMERAAMSTADLTARLSTVDEAMIDDLFEAASQTLSPYDLGTDGVVILTNVSRSGANNPVVNWQRRSTGGPSETSQIGVEGADATLPAGFTLDAGQSVIIAEVYYAYAPLMFERLFSDDTLYHRAFFRPRLSALTQVQP